MMSAIAVLDPAALVVGGLGGEGAVGSDGVDELRALAFHKAGLLGQQNVEVDLAEGRGLVDDAGAGIDRDEVRRQRPARRSCCRPPALRVGPWCFAERLE